MYLSVCARRAFTSYPIRPPRAPASSRLNDTTYSYSCMQAKFSVLVQWLQHIIDYQPHHEHNDRLNESSKRPYQIFGTSSTPLILFRTIALTFNPRQIVVLKVYMPLSSKRSPLNITLDAIIPSPKSPKVEREIGLKKGVKDCGVHSPSGVKTPSSPGRVSQPGAVNLAELM